MLVQPINIILGHTLDMDITCMELRHGRKDRDLRPQRSQHSGSPGKCPMHVPLKSPYKRSLPEYCSGLRHHRHGNCRIDRMTLGLPLPYHDNYKYRDTSSRPELYPPRIPRIGNYIDRRTPLRQRGLKSLELAYFRPKFKRTLTYVGHLAVSGVGLGHERTGGMLGWTKSSVLGIGQPESAA